MPLLRAIAARCAAPSPVARKAKWDEGGAGGANARLEVDVAGEDTRGWGPYHG